jgi:hypothetical protein
VSLRHPFFPCKSMCSVSGGKEGALRNGRLPSSRDCEPTYHDVNHVGLPSSRHEEGVPRRRIAPCRAEMFAFPAAIADIQQRFVDDSPACLSKRVPTNLLEDLSPQPVLTASALLISQPREQMGCAAFKISVLVLAAT